MDRILTVTLARADAGARLLVMAAAAAMVVVVFAQVVMRYALNGSFDWADEISRLAFVTTIFLAIPLGIRDGTHVGIDLFVSRLPLRLRDTISRLMSALAALLMVIVFWTAIVVAGTTWSERIGAINITSSVFFLPVILGALHAALHLVHMVVSPNDIPLEVAP